LGDQLFDLFGVAFFAVDECLPPETQYRLDRMELSRLVPSGGVLAIDGFSATT
jgi:hypothetical protein